VFKVDLSWQINKKIRLWWWHWQCTINFFLTCGNAPQKFSDCFWLFDATSNGIGTDANKCDVAVLQVENYSVVMVHCRCHLAASGKCWGQSYSGGVVVHFKHSQKTQIAQ